MNLSPPLTSLRAAGYDDDFVCWLEQQLALLRARKFDELDLENVIEEFEAMGRSERRELSSRLQVLLMHLLKCQYQPGRKTRSWLGTIIEQRAAILDHLEQSPSLRQQVGPFAGKAYNTAVELAANQTGLPMSSFPAENPYTPQQLLDPDFVP